MEYRFAVGSQNGPRFGSWKLWSQGDEVYLADRNLAHVQKFSFHKSERNRWVFIHKPPDGSDRAFAKWQRGPTPQVGSDKACLLIAVIFPTNHLSTACPDKPGRVRWIDPAPAGMATVVEVFLTNDAQPAIEAGFAEGGLRTLRAFGPLRNGPNLGAATLHFDCGLVECRLPRDR